MARAARTRIAMVGAGAALLAGSGALAREGLGEAETALFRRVNDNPDAAAGANWVLMLGGTFGAVPAASIVALLAGRRRLATRLAMGGVSAYVLAKAVKSFVGRGRPGNLLDDVAFRDEIGGDHGWVSGHTAVSSTIALIAGPSLPAGARAGAYAWAAAVGTGRMYAGAHLPLDIAGGLGLGMIIAAVFEPRG
jgi:membrane-associated phospholipid phosphatase